MRISWTRSMSCNFYSRPCGRGDRRGPSCRQSWAGYFYSRPCGRGDGKQKKLWTKEKISTHAPAGGATGLHACEQPIDVLISTHAPAGGATIDKKLGKMQEHQISTHAPAGGATAGRLRHAARSFHFYSRPCGRGDNFRRRCCPCTWYFYSRPCGRGDAVGGQDAERRRIISTHAPAGGATMFR